MLRYEHARATDVVHRLLELLRLVRAVIIVVSVMGVGGMGALIGRLVGIGMAGGGFMGLVLGLVLGVFAASLVTIGIEWMAHMLVAQGEIVAALRARTEPQD